jgi:YbbR domain-containing protein
VSEGLRTWGLRLLALGIALGLWFNSSFEDREALSERLVTASVSYTWPQGYIVLDQEQEVQVRVRGSSKRVRELDPGQVDVQVELGRRRGSVAVSLGPDNVLTPDGLEVMSVAPSTLTVEVDREISRRIRVVPDLQGQAAPGTRVEEPEVFPNQVLVTGPESLVSRTEVIHTRPVNLAGRSATFEERVPVVPPDPLLQVMQPSRVSVRVPIQPPKPRNGAPAVQTEEP